MVRGEQCPHGDRLVNAAEGLPRKVGIQLNMFSVLGGFTNFGHFFYCFERVFACSRFGTQHDRVGAVEHCIGHIAHFGAGRHRIGNHAFHHLRGGDHHFVMQTRQLDHAFL